MKQERALTSAMVACSAATGSGSARMSITPARAATRALAMSSSRDDAAVLASWAAPYRSRKRPAAGYTTFKSHIRVLRR